MKNTTFGTATAVARAPELNKQGKSRLLNLSKLETAACRRY
jgi:hypothetical protein